MRALEALTPLLLILILVSTGAAVAMLGGNITPLTYYDRIKIRLAGTASASLPVGKSLYLLKAVPLRVTPGDLAFLVESLAGWRIGPGEVMIEEWWLRCVERVNSTMLLDVALSKYGSIRLYTASTTPVLYWKGSRDKLLSQAVEEARRLVEEATKFLALRGAGLGGWNFSITGAWFEERVYYNATSGAAYRRPGLLAVGLKALYRGVRVHGVYRVDFYPGFRVADLYLDFWNVVPVKKFSDGEILGLEEALSLHIGKSGFEKILGRRVVVVNISSVALEYLPFKTSSGDVYLAPFYTVVLEGKLIRLHVPAVWDDQLYHLLSSSYRGEEENQGGPGRPRNCNATDLTMGMVSRMTLYRGGRAEQLGPVDAEKWLRFAIRVLADHVFEDTLCAPNTSDVIRVLQRETGLLIELQRRVTINLRHNMVGCKAYWAYWIAIAPAKEGAKKYKVYLLSGTPPENATIVPWSLIVVAR